MRVPARASVWHKGQLCGYYSVRDVSIGGCALSGGAMRSIGERLELLMHLPHRASIALSATVRRSDDVGMGLSFERATPRAEDCIQDLVVEAFASIRAEAEGHVALVIEPRHATRQAVLRSLRELGQRAVGVATALDAVQLLVEQGERVDLAFIEVEASSLPSLELVEYLAQHHPRMRRVLIGEPSEIASCWTAEATGDVHALLETPCSENALRRVLSRLQCVPPEGTLS